MDPDLIGGNVQTYVQKLTRNEFERVYGFRWAAREQRRKAGRDEPGREGVHTQHNAHR